MKYVSAILVAVGLALSGCSGSTSLPHTQAGDPQQPPDFQLLTDVPIPSGATMDNERSLILGDRDRWTGRVVMKLWKSAGDATLFYQQQMPAFGWEPIMAVTSGVSVMAYVRGDRAATVQVEKSSVWGSTILVTVSQRVVTSPQSSLSAPVSGFAAPAADPKGTIRSESLAPVRR